ncbi:glycosyltransferase family 2 protein [Flavobacterium sp. LC2016-12]|uniref:glycosyltransferase family 2 protein n=1 Tax=Flavobacterium sp. LC2016-12 TaxID=2783794 RepID=UPI00188C9A4D|nr:glycosyltransferase family 2 protein [Flavobacterium sp. LC2016-12]MBF4465678.1 glycosyltransferase family 2 protein [Flavobacterium sp. LC2016-12]
MNEKKNISVIIPHWNTPKLLQRCLDSIPMLDDIEVIVVDDNSTNIDKDNFPGIGRKNTKVVFSEKSITAGGARNIGLDNAVGKWIIFADADDFFHDNFYKIVSQFFDKDFDVVNFALNSVHSDTLQPAERVPKIVEQLTKASEGDEIAKEYIRYKFLYPSCKLIRRSLVYTNNIRFDEVPASNDVMFTMKVATSTEKISYNPEVIYCLTYREDSLVRSNSYKNLKSRLSVAINQYNHLKKFGKENYTQSILSHWWKLRKVGYSKLFVNIPYMVVNYKPKALYNDLKFAIVHRIKNSLTK